VPAVRALALFVSRWGADASSNVLRERARCTRCGRRGADLQHASWGNSVIGYAPFPMK
jgi:hypothetical protein